MTPKRAKPWSKTLDVQGATVRLYERTPGGPLYVESRDGAGGKSRKSLGHADRKLGEEQARAVAQRLAELRTAGTTRTLTLGQLVALYFEHRGPLLSTVRLRAARAIAGLLERHFGRDFAVEDLSQHHLDAYTAARRSGKVKSPRRRMPGEGVRDGTIRNELQVLAAMLHWAQGHRVRGRRLLTLDPLEGLALPREQNIRRPVATEARFAATLAQSDAIDPLGRFRLLLQLARHTGRRVKAMCELRASDVLRTPDAVERALGETGQPVAAAQHWPHGAVKWRAAVDKKHFEAVVPLSAPARAALDAYLSAHPRVGHAPLLPSPTDDAKPVDKLHAGYWLRRAETRAKLPKLERGAWHAFRRLFASERRHLPPQDVMVAGGWRSLAVMQTAYQHSDPATVYAVLEAPTAVVRPALGTPTPKRARKGGAADSSRTHRARK